MNRVLPCMQCQSQSLWEPLSILKYIWRLLYFFFFLILYLLSFIGFNFVCYNNEIKRMSIVCCFSDSTYTSSHYILMDPMIIIIHLCFPVPCSFCIFVIHHFHPLYLLSIHNLFFEVLSTHRFILVYFIFGLTEYRWLCFLSCAANGMERLWQVATFSSLDKICIKFQSKMPKADWKIRKKWRFLLGKKMLI